MVVVSHALEPTRSVRETCREPRGSARIVRPCCVMRNMLMLLAALDTILSTEDMNVPGFRLHSLKGSERSMVCVDNWKLALHVQRQTCLLLGL